MMMSIKQGRSTNYLKLALRDHSCPSTKRTRHTSVLPMNRSARNVHSVYCNISDFTLVLWIILVSCFSGQSIIETSKPLNRGVDNGDTVQLNCSTEEPENGYWKYKKPFETNWRRIYDGDKVVNGMRSLFYVDDSVQGRFNLIFNASESTAGQYTCQPDINLADQSAEVIVFDTSPNCSMTVTSGIVNASCRIDFRGNWAPKVVWFNMNERLETTDSITIPNHRVTSFLIAPLNQTDNLTCTTMFELDDKPRDTTATNVPDLHKKCTPTIRSSSDVSSTQTTTVTTTATTPPPPFYIIGIVCACVIVTVLIMFIILVLYKRKVILWKKSTRRSEKKGPSEVVLL